jgi:hypothetical protein
MTATPGLRVVERVLESLEPAAPYVADTPGGFTWWPHACPQHVVVAGEVDAAGETLGRVQVRHDLVRGVAGSAAQFAVLSDWNARHPGLSALRWDGETGDVALVAGADVRASGEDAAARRLATAALLQLGDGVRDGAQLAAALGGESAVSRAPGAPLRVEPDALCEGWRRFADVGAAPLELGEVLERTAAMTPPPWLRVRVDAAGLHAELPCAPPGAAAPSAPGQGAATLHLLAAEPHPILGAGLLGVLRLPADAEPVEGRRFATAALLNAGQSREWTGTDALGAWCVHPAAGLSHVAFHPALLVDAGLPGELAWGAGVRARWAVGFLGRVAKLRGAG